MYKHIAIFISILFLTFSGCDQEQSKQTQTRRAPENINDQLKADIPYWLIQQKGKTLSCTESVQNKFSGFDSAHLYEMEFEADGEVTISFTPSFPTTFVPVLVLYDGTFGYQLEDAVVGTFDGDNPLELTVDLDGQRPYLVAVFSEEYQSWTKYSLSVQCGSTCEADSDCPVGLNCLDGDCLSVDHCMAEPVCPEDTHTSAIPCVPDESSCEKVTVCGKSLYCRNGCPLTGVICSWDCPFSGTLPSGAPCSYGAWNEETCSCETPGEGCFGDLDCKPNEWCRPSDPNGSPNVCVSFVKEGEFCGGNSPYHMNQCEEGLTCADRHPLILDTPGVCANPVTVDELSDDAEKWKGHFIATGGFVVIGIPECTSVYCSDEETCCESCAAPMYLSKTNNGYDSDDIMLLDGISNQFTCRDDECAGQLSCFPEPGYYQLRGWFNKGWLAGNVVTEWIDVMYYYDED